MTGYNSVGLEKLYEKAKGYFDSNGFKLNCDVLIRNKSSNYFANIVNSTDIMEPYLKDGGGDPYNPINQRLKGLFFFARPGITCASFFGDTRLEVPTNLLIEQSDRLYFSDFYCMARSNHYVILVVTKAGSVADRFCSRYLKELDFQNNPFLFREGSEWRVTYCLSGLVEILYTAPIELSHVVDNGAKISQVSAAGCGSSKPGGKAKRSCCSVCNISAVNALRSDICNPSYGVTMGLASSIARGSDLSSYREMSKINSYLFP